MRRIIRQPLPNAVEAYLSRKRDEVALADDVERTWKLARKTKTLRKVFDCLVRMAGMRQRCMYCEDSRGTTIEHFWPKSKYEAKCFLWENMLLLCQGCQSRKGDRFRLDSKGSPLLINPVDEDPWDFLFFEASTGILTARYEPNTGSPNPKGEHTTDSRVLPLNIEAITEGRVRTKNNILRAVRTFFRDVDSGRPLEESEGDLFQALKDNDDYGLSIWFFLRDGREDPPFDFLRLHYPKTWTQIARTIHDAQAARPTTVP